MKKNIESYFGNYFVVTFFEKNGLKDKINSMVKLQPSLFINFSEDTMELTCKGDVGYVLKKGSQKEYIFLYIYEKAFKGFAEEEIAEIKDSEGNILWKYLGEKDPSSLFTLPYEDELDM